MTLVSDPCLSCCAFRSAVHPINVLSEHSLRPTQRGCFEILEPRSHLFRTDLDVERAVLDVESDGVSFAQGCDRSTDKCFRCDVACGASASRSAESPVREQRNGVAQVRMATHGRRNLEHL